MLHFDFKHGVFLLIPIQTKVAEIDTKWNKKENWNWFSYDYKLLHWLRTHHGHPLTTILTEVRFA